MITSVAFAPLDPNGNERRRIGQEVDFTCLIRTVANVDELDGLLAERLRAVLNAEGQRREDIAQAMSLLGFRWTGNTVSQVVNGRRGLSVLEVAGLCEALESPLQQFLGPQGTVTLANGRVVSAAQIADALSTGGGDWKTRATVRALFRQDVDEATAKAARRLGVEPQQVEEAATALWGRPLSAERDHHIKSDDIDLNAPENRRTLQARRGHATRPLIEELRTYFAERQQ